MKYKGVLIEQISIFAHPALYLQISLLLIEDIVAWLKAFLMKRGILIVLALTLWFIISSIQALQTVQDIAYFGAYWVVLGIASSIGLGTGLHTFVLYLGPHIAKYTIAASHCGHLPEMIPSRWNFDHFSDCAQTPTHGALSIFSILMAVQVQSFLWGLGTAIGQLPPYFVAKKASQTRAELKKMSNEAEGKTQAIDEQQNKLIEKQHQQHHISNEQIQEVLQLKRQSSKTIMERAKIFIYDNMQRYGFWTILACASIPNPLFDLAGITCGHFRIPFKTFFSATFIGKAIIKVHIQMIFVISIFRKESLDFIISAIKHISSNFAVTVANNLQEQKKVLYQPSIFQENKPLIAKLWDVFIIGMVIYFLKSIIDAQIQEKAIELSNSKHKQ